MAKRFAMRKDAIYSTIPTTPKRMRCSTRSEIYSPFVDTPNTRDLQFLITDGETFCHEERRDLLHNTDYPEKNALLYRLTNSDPAGRYRLIKEIVTDPHSPVLLMRTRVEIFDGTLAGKLRLYVLLAPHLNGTGKINSAHWGSIGNRKLVHAFREGMSLVWGGVPDFREGMSLVLG